MDNDADYRCPITQEIMTDPVIIESGITYERDAITTWLRDHTTCPMTNSIVNPTTIISNIGMRNTIRELYPAVRDPRPKFDGLLPFQIPHTQALIKALSNNCVIIDASDTGTGKTYCSMALCRHFEYKAIVFCPKSVIMSWIHVAQLFGVSIKIANYEMIKNGNIYDVKDETMTRETALYFNPIRLYDSCTCKYKLLCYDYVEGSIPEDTLVIFDEAHRCKNKDTENSKLLTSLSQSSVKILLMSATLTDKVPSFATFGLMLNLYPDIEDYSHWLRSRKIADTDVARHRKIKGMIMGPSWSSEDNSIAILHIVLFPRYGSRISIKQLGNVFPQNTVTADCYFMKDYGQVQAQYDEINYCLNRLKLKEYEAISILPRLIRAKQRVEILKVPLYLQLIEEAFDNNYSVIMFTNYIETLTTLAKRLNTTCCIRGGQSLVDREKNIQRFQSNESPIILCSIPSGGVGISLHDIHGEHPRMSIISPTWSGQDLVQAVGRAHRAGAKTPVLQKIVYCAKTYEVRICKIIKRKLMNISGINDGDLMGLDFPEVSKNDDEFVSSTYEVLTPIEYEKINKRLVQ